MRGKSHIALGEYLIWRYLPGIPGRHKTAFLLGCIQPDRNPMTYLKGSLRCQWLRGHNYPNARRFMIRISRRLEQKKMLNLFDYYTLGKLIHYTADAFTAAHNSYYTGSLAEHRRYEVFLQQYFLVYLQHGPQPNIRPSQTIMEGINSFHRDYLSGDSGIQRDTMFAVKACCCVLAVLMIPRVIP